MKGVPYYKIAEDFFKLVEKSENNIIVSPILLREISFKLGDKYNLAKEFFDKSSYIKIIKTTPDDYSFARKLESESNYELSFFDCLHIAISKRLDLNLITRDQKLIEIATKHVSVNKPEELIN